MKTKVKIFTGVLVAAMLVFGALSVSAYTGDYSFEIAARVNGTNVHSLANVSTSTTAEADSYHWDYSVSSTKYEYTVELDKSWLTSYKTRIKADGSSYTKSFGVVSSGDYTINVIKNTGSTGYVIGEGTINQ